MIFCVPTTSWFSRKMHHLHVLFFEGGKLFWGLFFSVIPPAIWGHKASGYRKGIWEGKLMLPARLQTLPPQVKQEGQPCRVTPGRHKAPQPAHPQGIADPHLESQALLPSGAGVEGRSAWCGVAWDCWLVRPRQFGKPLWLHDDSSHGVFLSQNDFNKKINKFFFKKKCFLQKK